MPVIQFRRNAKQIQVEDFPKECKRTVEGAMYVRPGATAVITDAELKHLQDRKIPLLVVPEKAPAKPAPEDSPDKPDLEAAGAPGDEDASDAPTEPPAAPEEAPASPEEASGISGKGKKRDKRRS